MATHVPVRGLYETHLTVSDLDRSIAFYRDVVPTVGLVLYRLYTQATAISKPQRAAPAGTST